MTNQDNHKESYFLMGLKRGDEAVFTEFYNEFSPVIYFNVLKMVKEQDVAMEVVQEVFTRLWKARATINIENSLSGYLFRIAQNCVFDFFKKVQRNSQLVKKYSELASDNYSHVEEEIFRKERSKLIHDALESLPSQQRKVYQLCVVEGKSYKETSSILNISTNTISEYLGKARLKMQQFIESRKEGFSLVLLGVLIDFTCFL